MGRENLLAVTVFPQAPTTGPEEDKHAHAIQKTSQILPPYFPVTVHARKRPKDRAQTHLKTRLAPERHCTCLSREATASQVLQCLLPPTHRAKVRFVICQPSTQSPALPQHRTHLQDTQGGFAFVHCLRHPPGHCDPGAVAQHPHSLHPRPSAGHSGLSGREGRREGRLRSAECMCIHQPSRRPKSPLPLMEPEFPTLCRVSFSRALCLFALLSGR